VKETLETANIRKCKSVSLPAISSGIFGFPRDLCAFHFFRAAEDFSKENSSENASLKIVRFTNFDDLTVGYFEDEFKKRYRSLPI